MNVMLSAILGVLMAAPAWAGGPMLEYKGRLTDDAGRAQEGTFLLHFRLWDKVKGGNKVWEESRYVPVQKGRFRVLLGDRTAIPENALASAYRLTVAVPAGTGWTAETLEPVRIVGGAPKPAVKRPKIRRRTAVPAVKKPPKKPAEPPKAETPPVEAAVRPSVSGSASAPGMVEASSAGSAAAAMPNELGRLRREVQRSKAEARKARQEVEKSRKRLDAIEKKLKRGRVEERPASRIYVVRRGDTLRSIAIKVYGSAEHWMDLYRANNDRIQRGGELIPGQLLLVPAVAGR